MDPSHPVHVKLADYGVSRTVLPSGAKGFAGTPPFIAPEIIQHNGEETYTEKVRNKMFLLHYSLMYIHTCCNAYLEIQNLTALYRRKETSI